MCEERKDSNGQIAGHPDDYVEEFVYALGVQSDGRVVEECHPGLLEQGVGDAEPLPHAPGVAGHGPIRGLRQPDEPKELVDAVRPPRAWGSG